MHRQNTYKTSVGHLSIGGDSPILIQSMTDTDTEDALATAIQIKDLYEAGSEIVRLTINTPQAAASVTDIWTYLQNMGIDVPLVGDFHYNGHTLLTQYPECAQILSKYRINPGNVGFGHKKDKQFSSIIEIAMRYNKPIRIGANWGSLDQTLLKHLMDEESKKSLNQKRPNDELIQETLIRSVLNSAAFAEQCGLSSDQIILSCKVSRPIALIQLYETLAQRCQYPLHLGLTEAGMHYKGTTFSSTALSILLNQGIGDTIRVSLTPAPGEARTAEVKICQYILQALEIRHFAPSITACPGCGRTKSIFFRELALDIEQFIQQKLPIWRQTLSGFEDITIAVMGCIVNGPGESKHADIGISLPGNGEEPSCPVFIEGEKTMTLSGEHIAEQFKNIISTYVEKKYARSHERKHQHI